MEPAEAIPDAPPYSAGTWAELLARVATGCLLVFSGVIKLQELDSFLRTLDTMNLPVLASIPALQLQFAESLPWFELGLGVVLVLGITARGAMLVAGGLFLAFSIILATLLAQGIVVECGCLGPLLSSTVSPHHAALDLLLAGACLGAAWWKGKRMFAFAQGRGIKMIIGEEDTVPGDNDPGNLD